MLIPHWLKSLRNRLHTSVRPRVSKKRRNQRVAPKNVTVSVESLEDRLLLAGAGPQLISIFPNAGVTQPEDTGGRLQQNEVLETAPSELVFRFNPGQILDPSSLREGIQVFRSGFDGNFNNGSIPVGIGSLQIGDQPNEVVLRFASPLPDDHYQIVIRGAGNNPLQNSMQEPFNNGMDLSFFFEVDLGGQIEAVVHEPVVRSQILTVTDITSLTDGVTFTIQAGGKPITFEFDDDGISNADDDNVFAVDVSNATDSTQYAAQVGLALLDAVAVHGSALGLNVGQGNLPNSLVISASANTAFTPAISLPVAGFTIADDAIEQRENFVNVYFNASDPQNAIGKETLVIPAAAENGEFVINDGAQFTANNGSSSVTLTMDSGPAGRFNVNVGNGAVVRDGDFIVLDSQRFEFTTGPVLEVTATTLADMVIGGTFSLTDNNATTLTFEFTNGGVVTTTGAIAVDLTGIIGRADIVDRIVQAINAQSANGFLVTATALANNSGRISLINDTNVVVASQNGFTQSGNYGVTSGTAVHVEENFTSTQLAQALSNVVNGPANRGFNGGLVNFAGFGVMTSASFNNPSVFTNLNLSGDSGPLSINYYVGDSSAKIAASIASRISDQVGFGATARSGVVAGGWVVQLDEGRFTVPSGSAFTAYSGSNPTTVESPAFYQLIGTDGTLRLPDEVIYNADAGVATLRFNSPLSNGTYNLRIGDTFEATNTLSTTVNLGTRFGTVTATINEFIGGDPTTKNLNVNDIDLYRFNVLSGGQVDITLASSNGLSGVVRLFQQIGPNIVEIGDSTTGISANIGLGVYFVGVSSAGNESYSAVDGMGATGGTSTGSYRLTITTDVDPVSASDNNSSFDAAGNAATNLGNLGTEGQVVIAEIQPQLNDLPPEPGSNDEPGHRDIPISGDVPTNGENHLDNLDLTNIFGHFLGANRGTDAYAPLAVPTIAYTFQSYYGTDLQGNPLFNAITEVQKQRAREIFELYSKIAGVQFVEAASVREANAMGLQAMTIVTGDMRAVAPGAAGAPNDALKGLSGISGTPVNPNDPNDIVYAVAIMDAGENFSSQDNLYGEIWFQVAMQEIGQLLGLDHAFDLNAIMSNLPIDGEPVFPGDHDIVHMRRLYRRDSIDIDMYQFQVSEAGVVTIETIAERLSAPQNASQLNTVLRLYRQETDGTKTLIAQNDDYYGNDSFLSLRLSEGTYFVGVSSVGNENYDPRVANSGSEGLTDGQYELRLNLRPDIEPIPDDPSTSLPQDVSAKGRSVIRDVDNSLQFDDGDRKVTAIDGDSDGRAGGVHSFSFQVGDTIFVDKQAANYATSGPLGSVTNPYREIDQALIAADIRRMMNVNADPPNPIPVIVRIVGNSGTDGRVESLLDNVAYEIGFKNDPVNPGALVDGGMLEVPRDINVVIDAGAVFKLRDANLDAGSSAQGIDRSGGSLQILGTTFNDVIFTSWHDDTIGGDSDGVFTLGANPGDWGGIVFRGDSDYDFEYRSTQTKKNIFATNTGGISNPNNPFLYTFTGFPIPATGAELSFLAYGNFLEPNENLLIEFVDAAGNVIVTATLFDDNFNDNPNVVSEAAGANATTIAASIRLTEDQFNLLTTNGSLQVRVRASSAVDNINVIESLRVDLSVGTAVPVFLNTVNHATIMYSGGPVVVDSISRDFDAIHLVDARPTISNNTITLSANAAISGNPNSFNDTFEDARRYEHHLDRLGPDVHGNSVFSNEINGLRIRTELENGQPLEKLQVPARLTATDIVYVITENLVIDGSPGGLIIDQGPDPDITSDDVITKRTPGRLRIDPGVIVKLAGARIEMERGGSNFIAEGTPDAPIIFTSVNDDSIGTGGSFDTNNDNKLPPMLEVPFFPQTGSAQTPNPNPLGFALTYLEQNAAAFGLTPADLQNFVVTDSYASSGTGVSHLYLRQTLNDLEVRNADISIHVLPNGSVLTASSRFVSGLGALEGQPIAPDLSAEQALIALLEELNLPVPDDLVVVQEPELDPEGDGPGDPGNTTVISGDGISLQDIPANLSYVPVEGGGVALVWNFVIYTLDGQHGYHAAVDGDTGEIRLLDDWVAHATYNVYGLPLESPLFGDRTLDVDPHLNSDPFNPSPLGWHDTDGVTGAEFTTTSGNNVNAYTDRNNDDLPDAGSAPDGGANLVFDFPIDLTQSTLGFGDAAVTNLFYWNNILHDIHHRYGFDEAAGNFQVNNYGNGGLGGDPVEAQAQDGADIGIRNNANMLTPPDGISPRMQMYLFNTHPTAEPDSSLDAGVIIHEFGHGVSNRLTGGPANAGALQALQSAGMGEGWGDWHSLMFSQDATDNARDARGVGNYVLSLPPDGPGVRTQPYSYDMTVNSLTYGDILTQPFPHGWGEVWAATLWDLNWALIGGSDLDPRISTAGLGFDPDLYNGSGGNNLAMRLVMDGMKLQPSLPSFLDARNAILAADQALTGGAFQQTIWSVFARRGMGFSADDGGSADSLNITEAFDVPPVGQPPSAGDWSGLVFNAASSGNFDYVQVRYAGGTSPIAGGFAGFNTVEIIQADVRISNSLFENNASGLDPDTTSTDRIGRGSNVDATIFVRGAQPTIVSNIFENNQGDVISIDANSMQAEIYGDPGRSTGPIFTAPLFGTDDPNATTEYANNYGPLVRNNRMAGNEFNGMEVRGGELTTETVWDDTDIVHIVRDEIVVSNLHTYGGLRLQSSSRESLVVKLDGQNAGFTANGTESDIDDRVGGTLEILGTPGRPVVLTSLYDNLVGAGFAPDGTPLLNTVDPSGRQAAPGDWRSVMLDQFSNDRNVAVYNERERPTRLDNDINNIPNIQPNGAESLGALAPNQQAADDNRRAGYEIHGFINTDDPTDQDVYSFTGTAGTEVWFDIDRTAGSLDTVIELINANGTVVYARSDDSLAELEDPTLLDGLGLPLRKDERRGGDFYSTNPKDAGMRVILPGTAGSTNTYFVRVRSKGASVDAAPENQSGIADGVTSGEYQLQIRLRQEDEHPGSTVQLSEIRYATNGIVVRGMPGHSPLVGEAAERTEPEGASFNNTPAMATILGNILQSDLANFTVAGNLYDISPQGPDVADDLDFYRFDVIYDNLSPISGGSASFTFDVDFADGLARPDSALYLFQEGRDINGNLTYTLILSSTDSNVADDRPAPLEGNDLDDPSRGSVGALDPYIGSVQLGQGRYYAVVTSDVNLPQVLNQFETPGAVNQLVRLEPINSISRIVEDHMVTQGGTTPQDPATLTQLFDIRTPGNISIGEYLRDFDPFSTSDNNVTRNDSPIVPWNLGDVVMIVSRDSGPNQTQLLAVNPFTGAVLYSLGTFNQDVRDIDINRRTRKEFNVGNVPEQIAAGTIIALDVEDIANRTDANMGSLLTIGLEGSVNGPQILSTQDDGIQTFVPGPNGPVRANNGNGIGIQFNALSYNDGTRNGDQIESTLLVYAVGRRADIDADILYEFLPNGVATSAPQADRTGNALLGGAMTQIRERGILDTTLDSNPTGATGALGIPAPATNGIFNINDGDLFTVSDGVNPDVTFEMDAGPFGTFTTNTSGGADQVIRDGDFIALDGTRFEFDTGDVLRVLPGTNAAQLLGGTFSLNDGLTTVTFEFTLGGGATGANREINLTGVTNQAQAEIAIRNAINGAQAIGLQVQADSLAGSNSGRISLSHVNPGGPDIVVSSFNVANGLQLIADLDTPGANYVRVEEFFTASELATAVSQAVYGNNQAANAGLVNFADRNAITSFNFSNGAFTVQQAIDTDGPNAVQYFVGQTPNQVAQSMANAINAVVPGATASAPGQAVSLAAGFNFVAPTDPVFVISGNAPGGTITGLATVNGSLWAVTDEGGLYRVTGTTSVGGAALDFIESATDLIGLEFESLSAGPGFVEDGVYHDLLFGITGDGTIYAFDLNGVLQPVFLDGQTSISTGLGGVHGVSFSNLDRNLWHATEDFLNQPGSGGGLDLGFVNERDLPTGGVASNNDQSFNSLGFLVGGAQGTMETEYFSLQGYSAADQPTLYFSYFLEGDDQRDAFTVYIARPDGEFDLISGNGVNGSGLGQAFDNTDTWRQARINLSAYAGEPELKIRVEFNTGRASNIGNINDYGVELRARPGDALRDGQTFTIDAFRNPGDRAANIRQNVTFEFDMGFTVVMPPASQILDGDQITIGGPLGTQTFTFVLGGATSGTTIGYNLTDTAAQLASRLRDQIDALFGSLGVTTHLNGQRLNLSDATSVDETTRILVEGGQGVTPGNISVAIHAGMTDFEVREVIRQAIADNLLLDGSGNFRPVDVENIKAYREVIRVIGHTVVDAGPLGLTNTLPGSGPLPGGDRELRNFNNDFAGVYIDDFIIGFAERGETVLSAGNNPNFFLRGGGANVTEGNYQLEIRRGTEYTIGQLPAGNVVPAQVFDTNDRLTDQITITVPDGEHIADGQSFRLSDGVNTFVFEFEDLELNVGDPNFGIASTSDFAVGFRASESGHVIAVRLRDLLNSTQVRNVLKITSALAEGLITGTGGGRTNEVNVFGAISAAVNGSVDTALFLQPEVFTLNADPAINNILGNNVSTTIPHTSIEARGDGSYHYYTFTANEGDIGIFDIDFANFESELFLFDDKGNLLDSNDGFAFLPFPDAGSNSVLDAFLQVVFPKTGTYRIGVGEFNSDASNGRITGDAPDIGDFYTLHVSLSNPGEQLFADNFNAVGRLKIESFSDPTLHNRFIGDSNQPRFQGSIQISQNFIFDTEDVGILIDDNIRRPGTDQPVVGAPRQLPTPNDQRLTRGVKISNNVVAHFGDAGIVLNGVVNSGTVPLGAVPFHRIINNTIYGGLTRSGDGIRATNNVAPTLLNNIIANTQMAINADATSVGQTVVARSSYQNNGSIGTTGAGVNAQQLFAGESLFVDPTTNNFYLAAGARPIDSARNQFDDRDPIVQVAASIGIPRSNLFAPLFDAYGQFRTNDENTPNTGEGNPPFFDRGAIEREDIAGPTAQLIAPEDNDGLGLDLDPDNTEVFLVNQVVRQFIVGLDDIGIGIDDTSVNTTNLQLTFNGSLLTEGVDYLFRYNANTKQITLEAASGVFAFGDYRINLVNQNGIRDLAGNNLLANRQPAGTTAFDITIAPPPVVSIDDVTVTEGDSGITLATFTVSLSGPTQSTVSFNYQTFDGTATSTGIPGDGALDYQPTSGSVTFTPGGSLTQTFTVQIFGDTVLEQDESFNVSLTNPVDGSTIQATGTINDDELLLQLTPQTQTVVEGDIGNTDMTFTVTLIDKNTGLPADDRPFDVTVGYATLDDTAVAGEDYIAANGTVTISGNETSATFTVSVVGDEIQEIPVLEDFFVTLVNPVNAGIDPTFGTVPGQVTATIQDDDPKFRVDNPVVVEGDAGTRQMIFTVSLSSPVVSTATINYAIQNGTALAGQDYDVTSPGTLTFDPTNDPDLDGDNNPLTQQVVVNIRPDATPEGNETFSLVLSNPSSGGIATGMGTGIGTIIEDDPRITINDVEVIEGNSGTTTAVFTVTLSQAAPTDVTVNYTTSIGTGVTLPPAGTIFETESNDTVATAEALAPETFVLTENTDITDSQGVDISQTIPHVTIAGRGDGTFDFFSFSGTAGQRVVLDIDGATFDSQLFIFDSAGNVIASGSNDDGFVNGGPNGNGLDDGSSTTEDAFLEILLPGNDVYTIAVGRNDSVATPGGLAAGSSQLAIEDGDQYTLHISIENFASSGGGSSTGGPAVPDGTANPISDFNSVGTPSDGTAGNPGVLRIAAGETTGTITVVIQGDAQNELNENFFVRLSDAVGGVIEDGTGEGTIINDDAPIVSISNPVPTPEAGPLGNANVVTFTVTLSRPADFRTTIDFTTVDGTAIAGQDFVPATGQLVFQQGEQVKTISVLLIKDGQLNEGTETFGIQLSNPIGANFGDDDAVGTIIDNTGLVERVLTVVAPDAGQAGIVRVLDSINGSVRFEFEPYVGFTGGVRVATGDINNDGTPDIVTTPGPGFAPLVKVYSGVDGSLLTQFMGFDPGYLGGLYVATGDFAEGVFTQGDSFDDIIIGADAGGGPHVRVFSSATGSINNRQFTPANIQNRLLFNFFAYNPLFLGGVRVAGGDVTGDGVDDLIVGAGVGGGPHVQVFSGLTRSTTPVRSFFVYDPRFTGGIYVAAADVDVNSPSTGRAAEIITGAGRGGGPHVRVFNVVTNPVVVSEFFAYASNFLGGVRVSAGDVNGDTILDIITAPGPGGGPHVRAFDGRTVPGATVGSPPADIVNIMPYSPSFVGGLFVAGVLDVDVTQTLMAVQAGVANADTPVLTQADVDDAVDAALDRLRIAGVSEAQLDELSQVYVTVGDLNGDLVGLATSAGIVLDVDAAGNGWFIDPTPTLDEEFAATNGNELAAVDASAVGRIDLLTVVLHELGHKLGLGDIHSHLHPDALMNSTLPVGTRRLPSSDEMDEAFTDESLFDSLLLD